jgi:indolepyruvate decarboxylase
VPTGTARVTTLGELDEAMKSARASKSGAYIEIIGGKMDMPPALAYAHGRLNIPKYRSRCSNAQ